jgi:hypothetical protein
MAVTIRYTHGWNLLYQIVMLVASLALLAAIFSVAEPLLNALGPIGKAIQDAGESIGIPEVVFSIIGVVLGIAAFLAAMCGSVVLLMKTVLRPELPTYLYVRLSLFTPIPWQEAGEVSFLFEGDIAGRWYPLRELRRVPREFRHDVLMEFAEQRRWGGFQFRRQTQPPPRPVSPPPPPRVEDPRIARRRKAYETLGVPHTASAEEIKANYRRLMKKYHPDVYSHSQPELKKFAEEKAKALNAAYAELEGVNV